MEGDKSRWELLSELKKKANIKIAPIELDDDVSDEIYEIYSKSVRESDGFDVVVPENMYLAGGIFPVSPPRFQSRKETVYEVWAKYAIEEYNKDANKNLEFVDVIKANEEYATGVWYYLTIVAKDKDAAADDNAQLLTCHAKVWNGMWGDKTLKLFKIVSQQPIQNQNQVNESN